MVQGWRQDERTDSEGTSMAEHVGSTLPLPYHSGADSSEKSCGDARPAAKINHRSARERAAYFEVTRTNGAYCVFNQATTSATS